MVLVRSDGVHFTRKSPRVSGKSTVLCQAPTPLRNVGGERLYEIEKVVRTRVGKHGAEYLIKWAGYQSSENSWIDDLPSYFKSYKQRCSDDSDNVDSSDDSDNFDSDDNENDNNSMSDGEVSEEVVEDDNDDENECMYKGFSFSKRKRVKEDDDDAAAASIHPGMLKASKNERLAVNALIAMSAFVNEYIPPVDTKDFDYIHPGDTKDGDAIKLKRHTTADDTESDDE